jgi:hypothetical protein
VWHFLAESYASRKSHDLHIANKIETRLQRI